MGAGFRAARFVEKPDFDTAVRYHAAADYYWNGGMFVWRADVFLAEIGRHAPEVTAPFAPLEGLSPRSRGFTARLAAVYGKVPSISVDYALMERSNHVAVVPAPFPWSDVGSWPSLHEWLEKDQGPVIGPPEMIAEGTTRALVRVPKEKLVVLIDVDDLVVVDTGDALLISRLESGRRAGQVVQQLKARGWTRWL